MINVIERELARVRWEVAKLEAQAELLERLVVLNKEEADAGEELPIVEIKQEDDDNGEPDGSGVRAEGSSPSLSTYQPGKRKSWEPWEDSLVCKHTKADELAALLPHRNRNSCDQRRYLLKRNGQFEQLKALPPGEIPPPIFAPVSAPVQPTSRQVDTSNRTELVSAPPRKKGLTFEEQLARVANGEVGIADVVPFRKADPTFTMGGIATGMLS